MTDLMEALFEYINKVTLQNYLAVDSDYRISSTRREPCWRYMLAMSRP